MGPIHSPWLVAGQAETIDGKAQDLVTGYWPVAASRNFPMTPLAALVCCRRARWVPLWMRCRTRPHWFRRRQGLAGEGAAAAAAGQAAGGKLSIWL